MIEKVCPLCGNTFRHYPSNPKEYCSRACQSAASRTNTVCPTCGREFSFHRSWPRKYCSHACAGRANVGNIARWEPSSYTAKCEMCGKDFTTTPSANRGRFCSLACFGQWQSLNVRGANHPKTGKTLGRPRHLPPVTTLQCAICGRDFPTKLSHVARRRCCSKSCEAILFQETCTGARNPHWKGGGEGYYGPSWRKARRAVLRTAKGCAICGNPSTTGKALDVHHRVPFEVFGLERHEEANVLTNLVALCNICHLKEHRRPQA